MAITIKIKKVLVKGKPYVQFLDFNLLDKENLPEEYVKSPPAVYTVEDTLYVKFFNKEGSSCLADYCRSRKVPWEEFLWFLDICKKAGDRLHEINKKIKEEYKEFIEGKEEVYII